MNALHSEEQEHLQRLEDLEGDQVVAVHAEEGLVPTEKNSSKRKTTADSQKLCKVTHISSERRKIRKGCTYRVEGL